MRPFSLRRVPGVLVAGAGVLALAPGCQRNPDTSLRPIATGAPPHPAAIQASFVGSAACASCHLEQHKSQSRSHHAKTLFLMSRKRLGKLAPPAGNIPGTRLTLVVKGDRYGIAHSSQPNDVAPLDYALGSGKTGMTYVLLMGSDRLAEMRMSYFPRQKKWYITPGLENLSVDTPGNVRPGENARKCILCHAVTLPSNSLVAEERFLGVGCESCHGPGSAHIAAMRAGKLNESRMEKMGSWPATRLNNLCGKCHGTEQMLQMAQMSGDITNRFQPYGLMQSQCFKKSKDTLSCITCHDPHTNASTNQKTYEAACLKCHASPMAANRPPQLRATAIKPCPVNPMEDCVTCHMPKRKAIATSQVPIVMPDHFIRVHS